MEKKRAAPSLLQNALYWDNAVSSKVMQIRQDRSLKQSDHQRGHNIQQKVRSSGSVKFPTPFFWFVSRLHCPRSWVAQGCHTSFIADTVTEQAFPFKEAFNQRCLSESYTTCDRILSQTGLLITRQKKKKRKRQQNKAKKPTENKTLAEVHKSGTGNVYTNANPIV